MDINYIHENVLEVRDYECDIQGIVNNAIYQNYLEHCRHMFLKSIGLDFAQLHNEGKDLVLVHADIKYIRSLKSGNKFICKLALQKVRRLKLIFIQDIYIENTGEHILSAKMTAACLKDGKPSLDETIVDIIGSHLDFEL
ncbi:acyl-CoA thioesterase [bacterium]|nr:acyl-CoA thioesterase [bacterium]